MQPTWKCDGCGKEQRFKANHQFRWVFLHREHNGQMWIQLCPSCRSRLDPQLSSISSKSTASQR
ncbi:MULTISPECIES: hypothetical protein [Chelativorans]|jgi:hypothetical protein|uniref:hypothetical protein n=1 Tax=Chelativorans TaxID=449972 RepID=UPI0002FF192E|nr:MULTISPECIES: hypothetical protein [Chelativorans]